MNDPGSPDPKTSGEARWKLVAAGDAATECIGKHYMDLKIPANLQLHNPGGHTKPNPMQAPAILRERARWVLEAIHTPAVMAHKKDMPSLTE